MRMYHYEAGEEGVYCAKE